MRERQQTATKWHRKQANTRRTRAGAGGARVTGVADAASSSLHQETQRKGMARQIVGKLHDHGGSTQATCWPFSPLVVEWAPHGVAVWPLRQKESTGHALHLDTNDSSASRTSADHRSAANNGTHSVTAEAPAALVRPAAQATLAVSPAHQEPASHAARHDTEHTT